MELGTDPEGATPLTHEEMEGLIPSWIATRSELDAAEQENIFSAFVWAFSGKTRWTPSRILDRLRLAELHVRMFGNVWKWAGAWRRRLTNIGVEPMLIPMELENLTQDVSAQIEDPDHLPWPIDEIAIRFHHRLVSIHPFPNGNGRHARFAADLLAVSMGRPRFAWAGDSTLADSNPNRREYLRALRVADREMNYEPLLHFARVTGFHV